MFVLQSKLYLINGRQSKSYGRLFKYCKTENIVLLWLLKFVIQRRVSRPCLILFRKALFHGLAVGVPVLSEIGFPKHVLR